MRRNKAWWSKYTREERWKICNFERNHHKHTHFGGYLPDDCTECAVCGNACFGGSPCTHCLNEYDRLMNKQ